MPLGRPRALDDAKRREVCALLTAGFEFQEAARYIGCARQTLRREMRRNPEFRRAVQDALLGSRLAPEKMLRQAAGRNWRAAAWLLERTEPHVYGRGAPPACTPDDLDAACRWIIDVALHEVRPEQRDEAFDRLVAVLDDVKAQIDRRTTSKQPLRTPATGFFDLAEMMRQANPSPASERLLFPGDQNAAVKKPSSNGPSGPRGQSANAASDSAARGQKSGLKSPQTCSPRDPKLDPPPPKKPPRRSGRRHAS
jgi:hypothetical protein